MRKNFILALSLIVFTILWIKGIPVQASGIDPGGEDLHYAWGENIGWIDLNPGFDAGVTVTNDGLTGYAWGENIGWIGFACENDNSCGTVDYGVNNDGDGNLSGYAWAENIGWISFSCENTGTCGEVSYGVVIDPVTGKFTGYAWGENVGWISFACENDDSCNEVEYGVSTAWHPADVDGDGLPNTVEDTYCTDSANPDSDGDGLSDGQEDQNFDGVVDAAETDPCDDDTDDDQMTDGWEVDNQLDPLSDDSQDDPDQDGYTNLEEFLFGSDPHNSEDHPPLRGDINSDQAVDLADALLALKVQSGLNIGEPLELFAEIDKDGRIGLAEALYALRIAAALNEPPEMDIRPTSLYLSVDRTQETITIFNTAGGNLSWSIDVASLPAWITAIDPVSGDLSSGTSEVVTITVDRTGLDPGLSYKATIPVASNGGDTDIELTLGFENGWSRSIGMGNYYTEYHSDSIQQTSDGGYVFVFENTYGGAGGYDYGVAKLTADGSLQWARDFGVSSTSSGEAPKTVVQTDDGGYLAAGQSFISGLNYDLYLIKLDPSGSLEWQKRFSTSGHESPEVLARVPDSQGGADGYILAGYTTAFGAGGRDIWLLRLETNGDIRWQKAIGGSGDEYTRAIRPIEGGFWLVGSTTSFGAGGSDVWIVKLDTSGNVTWERVYGGTGSDSPVGIEPTDAGGCVIGAGSNSFVLDGNDNGDFWAFEINAEGNLQWQYIFGGLDHDYARDFRRTPDGGFIMTGWTYSFGEEFNSSVSNDAWLIKLDASGGVQWQKIYNKPLEYDGEVINAPDWAYSVTPTSDGGYAVVGDTDWYYWGERESDIWIFKVNSSGELGCGIDADSDAVPDNSGSVTITGPNAYTVTDTSVVPGTPGGQFFTITPEEFQHCGP